MKNKEIILWLITQDLKHRQFICGRCALPLNELPELSILNIIIKLMGVDVERDIVKVSRELVEVYYHFMEQVDAYPEFKSNSELRPLAEDCFKLLVGCVHIDKRRPKTQNVLQWMLSRLNIFHS